MSTNLIKHEGEIELVGVKLPCYVLEDGTRILSVQGIREVLKKIGAGDIERKSGEKLNQYLNQKSSKFLVENKERETSPIIGYEATMLEDLFNVYLQATKGSIKLSLK